MESLFKRLIHYPILKAQLPYRGVSWYYFRMESQPKNSSIRKLRVYAKEIHAACNTRNSVRYPTASTYNRKRAMMKSSVEIHTCGNKRIPILLNLVNAENANNDCKQRMQTKKTSRLFNNSSSQNLCTLMLAWRIDTDERVQFSSQSMTLCWY